MTGDINDAYFQALRDHRSDSILSGDAAGAGAGDVDSLPARGSGSAPNSAGNSPPNGAKGGLARKVQAMRIEEGDEEERAEGEGGDILAVDGVEAAKSSGQLGQARPRGRMIGPRREANGNGNGAAMAVEALAAADPQNHPNGLRNEDMERLRDRFSGWV